MSERFTVPSFFIWVAFAVLLVTSACAPTAPRSSAWDHISGTAQVAKVNNIKSLITPGFK